jgi:hypothetical protein
MPTPNATKPTQQKADQSQGKQQNSGNATNASSSSGAAPPALSVKFNKTTTSKSPAKSPAIAAAAPSCNNSQNSSSIITDATRTQMAGQQNISSQIATFASDPTKILLTDKLD